MKKRLVWLGLLGGMALLGCSNSAPREGSMGAPASRLTPGQKELLGKAAPAFRLDRLEGGQVGPSAHKGEVLILDFWATWCSPCLKTMPILHKIADEFSGRGVVLYSINEGESPEMMQEFLAKQDFKPQVLLDTDMEVAALYQVDGLPYTVLVDRAGSVRALHIGFFSGFEETLRSEISRLADDPEQAAR